MIKFTCLPNNRYVFIFNSAKVFYNTFINSPCSPTTTKNQYYFLLIHKSEIFQCIFLSSLQFIKILPDRISGKNYFIFRKIFIHIFIGNTNFFSLFPQDFISDTGKRILLLNQGRNSFFRSTPENRTAGISSNPNYHRRLKPIYNSSCNKQTAKKFNNKNNIFKR